MAGLKRRLPGIGGYADGFKITPDEQDAYKNYTMMPGVNVRWWASAGTAGTASSTALVILNRSADYPRNVGFILAGSATGMAGSLDVVGKDQFGNTISETLGFGSADNGGTVVGTKVFAQVASGTLRYGTAVGNGTPQIGFVPGTDCLLGLPVKLGAATDVRHLGQNVGTGAVSYNGGTIAGFVNVAQSAIRPAATITPGTTIINAWVVSSYDASEIGTVSNLQAAT